MSRNDGHGKVKHGSDIVLVQMTRLDKVRQGKAYKRAVKSAIMGTLLKPYTWQREGGAIMKQTFLFILESVMANVIGASI